MHVGRRTETIIEIPLLKRGDGYFVIPPFFEPLAG
jgi:hypothetical protein